MLTIKDFNPKPYEELSGWYREMLTETYTLYPPILTEEIRLCGNAAKDACFITKCTWCDNPRYRATIGEVEVCEVCANLPFGTTLGVSATILSEVLMLTIKDFSKPREPWDISDPEVYTVCWHGDPPFTSWRVGSCAYYPCVLSDELISSNAIPRAYIYAGTRCHCRTGGDICHFCRGSGDIIDYHYLRSIVNEHS